MPSLFPSSDKNTEPPFSQKPVDGGPPAVQEVTQAPPVAAPAPAGFYRTNRYYIWAIVAGLAVISVLGYFAFRKPSGQPVAEAKVTLSVEAPETTPSGGEVVYRIKVENQDPSTLVGMQLELTYPEGFTYISSSPKADNLSGTLFGVPSLTTGQNAAIIVKVKATGNINESKELLARLHYRFGNFNSDFTKDQSKAVRLVASDVILELNGPRETSNAQLVVYTLSYQNNSKNEIKNARIRLTYPEGFTFAQSQPQPDLGSNVWNLGALQQGGRGTITVQGSFKSATPGQSKALLAEFLILSSSGDYNTQSQATFTTAISSLPLLVSQELESQDAGTTISPGDTLNLKLRYQNNGTVAARGVNIRLQLEGKALDLSTLQAEGAQVSGNTVTWNAASLGSLETLSPNESGTLSLSVRVRNPATRDSSKNLTVTSTVEIKSGEYDAPFPGNELQLKVTSPSALTTKLDYVDGQLPPQVGKSTTYQVTFTLTNATNDFSDTAVTAFVPLGAGGFVEGSYSLSEAGKVTFDPATSKLTWRPGNLPAHAGSFTQPKVLSFKVRLTPSSSQVGQAAPLVKTIRYQARDLFTGQDISGQAGDVGTADLSGTDVYSKSQVQP